MPGHFKPLTGVTVFLNTMNSKTKSYYEKYLEKFALTIKPNWKKKWLCICEKISVKCCPRNVAVCNGVCYKQLTAAVAILDYYLITAGHVSSHQMKRVYLTSVGNPVFFVTFYLQNVYFFLFRLWSYERTGSSLICSHIYLRCPSKDWLFLSLCWALDN